jgi:hypothetical protein
MPGVAKCTKDINRTQAKALHKICAHSVRNNTCSHCTSILQLKRVLPVLVTASFTLYCAGAAASHLRTIVNGKMLSYYLLPNTYSCIVVLLHCQLHSEPLS